MIEDILQGDSVKTEFGTVIYNKTVYEFQVMLINPDQNVFVFRNSGIKNLTISDTIDSYFQQGTMVVTNDFDLLERPTMESGSSGAAPVNNAMPVNYLFRGDSRDILRISITPKLDQNSISQSSEPLKTMMSIVYDFVVYNVEEITGDSATEKYKKLYFWDIYHQILLEKKINFSTAKLSSKTFKNSNATPGAVSTGAAIQELLKATFPGSEGFTPVFGKFDAGGTDIFFSSPAGYSAHDCLMYLMDRHVGVPATNYDRCILSIERYPKQWSLISLKEHFDAAYNAANDAGGPLFLERLLIGGLKDNDPEQTAKGISRTPSNSTYLSDVGTIQSYSYVSAPGELTQNMVRTKVAHSYNFKNKTFYSDIGSNSFTSQQKVYQQNYVDSMQGDNDSPSSNLIGNAYRLNNLNIENIYSTSNNSKEQRFGVARNKSLTAAVFLNNTISVTLPGATYRQTGKFIAVERTDALESSKFDDKLLGIYLIVSVNHIFTDTSYTNEIVAVKTYNYRDLGQTENVI